MTLIFHADFSPDFKTVNYGGLNGNYEIFELVHGLYERKYREEKGIWIRSSKIDESGMYYITTDSSSLYTYYQCPSECAICSFPNNCSSCEEKYVLNERMCVPQPTHCVKNIVSTGNICKEYCHKNVSAVIKQEWIAMNVQSST